MEIVETSGIYAYVVVALTGFPFLIFVGRAAHDLAMKRWRWDRRRKLLLFNAAIYPVVFAGLFVVLVKVFAVNTEAQGAVHEMESRSTENIQRGSPPERNNVALGTLFVGALYSAATLVPTVILGLIWTVASTILLSRSGPGIMPAVAAFAASGVLTLGSVAIAWVFRTPIFNWFSS